MGAPKNYCARIVGHVAREIYRELTDRAEDFDLDRFRIADRTPSAGLSPAQRKAVGRMAALLQNQSKKIHSVCSLIEAAGFDEAFAQIASSRFGAIVRLIDDSTEKATPTPGGLLDTRKSCRDMLLALDQEAQAALTPNGVLTHRPTTFTLLFLTDFHWGAEGYEGRWQSVQKPFFDSLKDVLAGGRELDLVIFGGDLAFSGKLSEYDGGELKDTRSFNAFLRSFWESLKVNCRCNPPLVTVPGNHDLTRPSESSSRNRAALMNRYLDQDAVRKSVWDFPKSDERQLIDASFRDYRQWQKWNLRHQRGEGKLPEGSYNESEFPGDFSYRLKKGGATLGVVGLNSAFLQLTDEDFEGKLPLEPTQIHAVCKPTARDWLAQNDANVLVTHHPCGWLSKGHQEVFRKDICAPGLVDVHLHGHLHAPGLEDVGSQVNSSVMSIQGPALSGIETYYDRKGKVSLVQRLHGYVVVEIVTSSPVENRIRFRHRVLTPDFRFDEPNNIAIDRSTGWTDTIMRHRVR